MCFILNICVKKDLKYLGSDILLIKKKCWSGTTHLLNLTLKVSSVALLGVGCKISMKDAKGVKMAKLVIAAFYFFTHNS